MSLPIRLCRRHPEPNSSYVLQSWEVGIDFGSTYSAAGFCLTSDDAHTDLIQTHDIQKVTGYPQDRGGHSGKSSRCEVPTQLWYGPNDDRILYGYEAAQARKSPLASTGTHYSLFKPNLNDRHTTNDQRGCLESVSNTTSVIKTADTATMDFLKLLLSHTKSRMILKGYDDRDSVHLACTVPAMWSLRAKRRTLVAVTKAAQIAGFHIEKDISIWSEPEAATAYVLATEKSVHWNEGDTFILIDAGGITMDVVTYTVLGTSPLRLKEVVRGEGISCGSSDLNKIYMEQVMDRLGHLQAQLSSMPNAKTFERLKQDIDDHFELSIKPRYKGPNELAEWVPVPGLPKDESKGFEPSEMAVTRDHLEKIFEPVLERAAAVVQRQWDAAYRKSRKPTRLVAVGGLSCSERFQLHMQQTAQYYTTRTQRPTITCIFPKSSDFAVAAGSICRSLNKCVVEDYISRSSIAICRHEIYQPRLAAHKDANPEFDDLEQREYVHDCVELLLKIDEVIPSTGLKKTFHLHRTIPYEQTDLVLSLSIYESEDQDVADHFPITHPRNRGKLYALDEVSFNIDVTELRSKLKKLNSKDTKRNFESLHGQRRSTRLRKGNPHRDVKAPERRPSGEQTQILVAESLQPLSPSPVPSGAPVNQEDTGKDFYWVDYQLDVEFKEMFMIYELRCPTTGGSVKGEVSLAPSLETWAADG